jgi:alpha-galactosidase
MSGPKIAIVGGGSFAWGPLFVRDLLIAPGLRDAQIVLYDLDPHALAAVGALADKMVVRLGRGCVATTTEAETALRGADFVILTITTGGLEAMRHDVEIPERYGVFQAVGDTVGPGGLLRALRNIPVIAALAQQMAQLCPSAWLLNYTNPMTTLCRAVTKTSPVRTIGLCHEWLGVRSRLGTYFGVPEEHFTARIAGINHLPWLLDLRVGDQDYMPQLHALAAETLAQHGQAEGLREDDTRSTVDRGLVKSRGAQAGQVGGLREDDTRSTLDRRLVKSRGSQAGQVEGLHEDDTRSTVDRGLVKSRLLQLYGALPVAGDRHVAEFFPFFLTEAAGRGKAWGIDRTPISERYTWRAEAEAEIAQLGQDEVRLDQFLANPSGEAAGPIITALATGGRYEGIMNLPNQGQVSCLPQGVVVETMGTIEAGGVRGEPAGEIPPAIAAILQRHSANQELAVAAALTGSREAALQSLLGDPLCPPDVHAAATMLDEMLAANRQYLPQFF